MNSGLGIVLFEKNERRSLDEWAEFGSVNGFNEFESLLILKEDKIVLAACFGGDPDLMIDEFAKKFPGEHLRRTMIVDGLASLRKLMKSDTWASGS